MSVWLPVLCSPFVPFFLLYCWAYQSGYIAIVIALKLLEWKLNFRSKLGLASMLY